MATATACPDARRWQRLIDGALPDVEQAEFQAHLEACPACQQTLERLTAGRPSWLGGAAPPAAETPPDAALGRAIADLKETESRAGQSRDSTEPPALEFLDPPERPGTLGRMAGYEVTEVVGWGGFGVVLKALDPKLNRYVAIKVLAPQLAASAAARKRFEREARAAAAVRNEHVVAIHAVDEFKGLPYLVMEYIAGVSLQDRLELRGPLRLEEILRIGNQAACGLAAAHAQGLIHRDIKPANILLENGVERVKITDFGLARAADDASVTQPGVVPGTPQYMAPEQARGEPLDHRADLFSLGSVLYLMCCGRPPYRGGETLAVLKRVSDESAPALRQLNPDIPEWLCGMIEKLHAKDPAGRYQSAAEVAGVLGAHLAHLQQPALAPLPPRPGPKSVPRSWRFGRAAAALALLLGFALLAATAPTLRLYALKRGVLVVELRDRVAHARLHVFQGDRQVALLDTQSYPQAELGPGVYRLELENATNPTPNGSHWYDDMVTISRGGRTVVTVGWHSTDKLGPALDKLASSQPETKEPEPLTAPPPPPKRREPYLLKAIDLAKVKPPESLPFQTTLKLEGREWRIEKLGGELKLTLAEIRDDVPDGGWLRFRARVRAKRTVDMYTIFGNIYVGLPVATYVSEAFSPDRPEGGILEARAPAHAMWTTDAPAITLGLSAAGAGTVWISDLEVWHDPPPPPDPPLGPKPGERLVRAYTHRDPTIHTDCVNELVDGWHWKPAKSRVARLFELFNLDVSDCKLVLRARMKTQNAAGAYLQMVCGVAGAVETTTPRPKHGAAGDTGWAPYEVEIEFARDVRLDYLRINLDLASKQTPSTPDEVWIKDVVLVKIPKNSPPPTRLETGLLPEQFVWNSDVLTPDYDVLRLAYDKGRKRVVWTLRPKPGKERPQEFEAQFRWWWAGAHRRFAYPLEFSSGKLGAEEVELAELDLGRITGLQGDWPSAVADATISVERAEPPPKPRPGEARLKLVGPFERLIAVPTRDEGTLGRVYNLNRDRSEIRLIEMQAPRFEEDCRLLLRVKLKTRGLTDGAAPQISVRLPGGAGAKSSPTSVLARGTTDRAEYEASLEIKKDQPPDLIRLNLVTQYLPEGELAVRDVELLKAPAR